MPGHVIAMGGGGFSTEPENPLLDAYVLARAGRPRPRVCFLATASGDAAAYTASFYRVLGRHHDAVLTDLPLFERTVADLRPFVLEQDVVYVGGGNTASLLGVWRAHGLDAILREALAAGAVLCGVSAGMNCWFESSLTDSFGPALAPLHDGLGLIAGSACPHYDGEPQRRPAYRALVGDGTLTSGYAADDGAALCFDADGALVEVVASRPGARAYRVEPGSERALEATALRRS
ncbi:MAG: dipeptidase [Solirubrobacteraceae bacterium]|jgi:peptidase E|nr:dipeptidase [Solirubrobacteraceae bacterium]